MLSERYQKDGSEHQVLQYLQYLPWLNLQGTPTYREYKDHLALCIDSKVAVVASCQVFPGFWKWESECRQGKKVGQVGYQVRLKFATMVAGSIIIGYAAHYSLGAMIPMREWVGVYQGIVQNNDMLMTSANY
ncbi:hypothetical protein [Chroogloeocystis siderophila]|uniref:Uncharacterized protein n=1 Tax=Chroogloeocystis siderophila 5.2 s.c.1 TaxID=247279 RepID=A0A1U7H9W9_9CHRO|nr:hypothetical protein [Chroogloeocystis siderophila]OKH20379.1 hypothetical protein NIES1031_23090 [Chroogloeocystis siderophila 5.2 s.c.1]